MCHKFKWLNCLVEYYIETAAILKGIAAVFYSTEIRISPVAYGHYYIKFQLGADCSINLYLFLFISVVDKPCLGTGCRSPPSLRFA